MDSPVQTHQVCLRSAWIYRDGSQATLLFLKNEVFMEKDDRSVRDLWNTPNRTFTKMKLWSYWHELIQLPQVMVVWKSISTQLGFYQVCQCLAWLKEDYFSFLFFEALQLKKEFHQFYLACSPCDPSQWFYPLFLLLSFFFLIGTVFLLLSFLLFL